MLNKKLQYLNAWTGFYCAYGLLKWTHSLASLHSKRETFSNIFPQEIFKFESYSCTDSLRIFILI